MTWLSRLLPNGRSSLQRATKRRRRIMKLELLENRTLLSNVTVSFAWRRPHDPGGQFQRLLQYH